MAAAPIVAKGAGEVAKALTGDIVKIDTQFYRQVEIGKGKDKQTVLVPIDVEVRVNPLGILLGVGALAATAIAATIAWNGVKVTGPLGAEVQVVTGLKDIPFFQRLATSARLRLSERQRGGYIIDGEFVADPTDDQICEELRRRRDDASRPPEDRNRAVRQAEQRGCPWATGE